MQRSAQNEVQSDILASWSSIIGLMASLATVLAFIIAAASFAVAARARREQQPRLVYARLADIQYLPQGAPLQVEGPELDTVTLIKASMKPDTISPLGYIAQEDLAQVTIEVCNGSDELISPARLHLVNIGRRVAYSDFSMPIPFVEPGTRKRLCFIVPVPSAFVQSGFGPLITFRDSGGRWWRRYWSEPIRRLPADAETGLETRQEREATRHFQETMGIPPENQVAEPKITLWMRLKRAWWHLTRFTFKSPHNLDDWLRLNR